MGYFFECTYCNKCIPTNLFEPDLERSCTECGEDMCASCYSEYDGMCQSCYLDNLDDAR